MALVLRDLPTVRDEEAIDRLSRANPGWQIELSASGDLIVSPTYSDSGARELAAGVQLQRFAERAGGRYSALHQASVFPMVRSNRRTRRGSAQSIWSD